MNPVFKQQIETLNNLVISYNLERLSCHKWQLINPLKNLIGISLQMFTVYVDENQDIWHDEKKFKNYNKMYTHIKVLKRLPVNEKTFDILENSVLDLHKRFNEI